MRRATALFALAALLTASSAHATDLPNFNASYAAPGAVRPAPRAGASPAAAAASADEQRPVPSFLWSLDQGSTASPLASISPETAARRHLARHAARYGLTDEALAAATVTQVHDVGRGGILVAFRQRIEGVDLLRSDAKVLMTRGLDLVAIGGALHAGAVAHPKGTHFKLTGMQAAASAFRDLYGVALGPSDFVDLRRAHGSYRYLDVLATPAVLSAELRLAAPVRVKRVYFPLPERVVAGYYVEVLASTTTSGGSDAYAYVVGGDDGRLLYRENLTHHDQFTYRVWADPTGNHRPLDGPLLDYTPHPTGVPDGSYPDFASPILVPMDGFNSNPVMKSDPWLPAGAMETRGNNVDAYTDDQAPDGFSPGDLRASITAPNTFDRVFDVHAGPQSSDAQRMAAVTQLFYVTNWMHDWWYDSGFNETAGNAQEDNYGRGGVAGDPLLAEGQDGAPATRNNSDMSVPGDGQSPTMQMFVWDGKVSSSLNVQPLAQSLSTGTAGFGPQTFNVAGALALVDDGTATVTDACEAIVNDVTGKIALVDRGTCSFKQKALNVQTAGAIGMLIADNQGNEPPPPMPDGSPAGSVTIAVQSISLADGSALKTALGSGAVTATMARDTVDVDGTIDNTVIAHEWGHYLHLRQVACGSPQCGAQSEGWGDFNALYMVVRPNDDLQGTFAMGQYATMMNSSDAGYFGIRRYPYSIDQTKSPLTFKHIMDSQALPAGVPAAQTGGGNAEVHNAGEIWAAMVFEGFIALLKEAALPNAPYDFDGARRRMGDYVEGGMKLAPTDPTFTEQRDAILAAAFAADPNDFLLLAKAFARRGAGSCAVSPARDSFDMSGVVESFDVASGALLGKVVLDDAVKSCDKDGYLDAEETGNLTVEIMNSGMLAMKGATLSVSTTTPGVTFPKGANVQLPPVDSLAKTSAVVEVRLDGTAKKKENLALELTLSDPTGCRPTTKLAMAPFVNFDKIPASSTVDDVEADTTTWTMSGTDAKAIWSIEEPTLGNHVWSGLDYGSPSSTQLTSPQLEVGMADELVLTFDHRHEFEASQGTNWDGAVIEVSEIGKAWADISTYGDPGYGGTIGDPQAQNPIKGRKGYVGKNASWPKTDTVTVNLGKTLAGKKVRIRFRIGTDDAQGAPGWELDNLGFKGITNTPFAALVGDASSCSVGPKADAGPDQSVASGDKVALDGSKSSDSSGNPLTFAWNEMAGPAASLEAASASKPTFIAPEVAEETTFTFQLTVSDGAASASDTVNIVVKPGSQTKSAGDSSEPLVPGGGCGCAVPGSSSGSQWGLIALAALLLARRRRQSS